MAALVLPAAMLSACGEAPRSTQAAAPAAGAVNPDPGVTRYTCSDGGAVTAGYPDPQTAVVTYKDHAYTLKLVQSASGARYAGFGLQWWTKGAHADLAPLKPDEDVATAPGISCTAEAPQPDAQVTKTTYRAGVQRGL